MNIITAQELKSKIDNNERFQLIDVREDYEFEENNIGGINIPLEKVFQSIGKIEQEQQVIFYCRTGNRSKAIIHTLERKLKLTNLFSLEGGIEKYLKMA